jgi:hypothetical protein
MIGDAKWKCWQPKRPSRRLYFFVGGTRFAPPTAGHWKRVCNILIRGIAYPQAAQPAEIPEGALLQRPKSCAHV